jgi:hypothetical protein
VSRVKPAQVRFYVDADILGLGRILASLRPDVTFPGDPGTVLFKKQRPPCVVTTPATLDTEWIPRVTAEGMLIITRDRQIQHHLAELQAVKEYRARMVALSGKDARGTFDQLEIVMCRWRDIEACLEQTGPFIYTATRTVFRRIDLHASGR